MIGWVLQKVKTPTLSTKRKNHLPFEFAPFPTPGPKKAGFRAMPASLRRLDAWLILMEGWRSWHLPSPETNSLPLNIGHPERKFHVNGNHWFCPRAGCWFRGRVVETAQKYGNMSNTDWASTEIRLVTWRREKARGDMFVRWTVISNLKVVLKCDVAYLEPTSSPCFAWSLGPFF